MEKDEQAAAAAFHQQQLAKQKNSMIGVTNFGPAGIGFNQKLLNSSSGFNGMIG
jgi:hypothetical protein